MIKTNYVRTFCGKMNTFFWEVGPLAALLALRWPLGRILAPGPGAWRTLGHLWQAPNHKNCYELLKQPHLGNESMYLHLPDLADTISYALGPGDRKTNAKTTSRSTYIESPTKKNKKSRIWSRNGPRRLNLSNESIFLDLA